MKNYNTVAKWIWKNEAVNSQTVEVKALKTFEVSNFFLWIKITDIEQQAIELYKS